MKLLMLIPSGFSKCPRRLHKGTSKYLSMDRTRQLMIGGAGREDAHVLILSASADLPQPLGPQMPINRGPIEDDGGGGEGRQGWRWHARNQLQRKRQEALCSLAQKHAKSFHPLQPKLSHTLMEKIRKKH